MSTTITEIIILNVETCIDCGIKFAVPREFQYERQNDQKSFYCPNGHPMVYRTSMKDQEIARLKREKDEAERSRNILRDQLAEKQEEVRKMLRSIERRKKRTLAGVCPCCNRTVGELAEHIKTKHPEMLPKKDIPMIHKKINSK